MTLSLQDLRQSAAELLAYVLSDLFPGIILVGGETSEWGFHYDFIATQPIDDHAIPLIEEKMRGFAKADQPIRLMEMMRENAADFLEHKGQEIRAQFVAEAPDNIVPIFSIGDFYDYCPSTFAISTKELIACKIFKVTSTSRYIPDRGDLQVVRIEGTAFPNLQSLKKFLKAYESTKKRNYAILGKELGLFTLNEGGSFRGFTWHPRGTAIKEIIIDWWHKELEEKDFQFVSSPLVIKTDLMQKIGEAADSLFVREGVDYTLRTSFFPLHAAIYHSKLYSYRQLPVRMAECGEVYQNSKETFFKGFSSGNTYWTDASSVFCTKEQVLEELISSLQFITKISKILGFECQWYLGLRGPKYAGRLADWEKGSRWVTSAMQACGLSVAGEEAQSFVGPYVEAHLQDSHGRQWKGPFVGLDFNCPERFGLHFQGIDDEMHMPIMIARSFFGPLERFVALLTEHYNGNFPLWMAPEQVRVIPIREQNISYAESVCKTLKKEGIRLSMDVRQDQLGKIIHAAEIERIPYMVIVGDNEEKKQMITVRSSGRDEIRTGIALESFLEEIKQEAAMKLLPKKHRK